MVDRLFYKQVSQVACKQPTSSKKTWGILDNEVSPGSRNPASFNAVRDGAEFPGGSIQAAGSGRAISGPGNGQSGAHSVPDSTGVGGQQKRSFCLANRQMEGRQRAEGGAQ